MADLKWFKLSCDLFDNRKIKYIRGMKRGDEIALLWIRLLCLAAEVNDDGRIYISQGIPVNTETVASSMDESVRLVGMALDVFESLGMIERGDGGIRVRNWSYYQSMDSKRTHRKKCIDSKKDQGIGEALPENGLERSADTYYVKDEERKERRIEEKRKENNTKEKNPPLREREGGGSSLTFDAQNAVKAPPPPPEREDIKQYGRFSNVLLRDPEYSELREICRDGCDELIESLSEYMAASGRKYKNHFATLLRWWKSGSYENGGQRKSASPCGRDASGNAYGKNARAASRQGDFDPEAAMEIQRRRFDEYCREQDELRRQEKLKNGSG